MSVVLLLPMAGPDVTNHVSHSYLIVQKMMVPQGICLYKSLFFHGNVKSHPPSWVPFSLPLDLALHPSSSSHIIHSALELRMGQSEPISQLSELNSDLLSPLPQVMSSSKSFYFFRAFIQAVFLNGILCSVISVNYVFIFL